MELTARQLMLVCKLLEDVDFPNDLFPEYAEIMDIFLIERDKQRREEENG